MLFTLRNRRNQVATCNVMRISFYAHNLYLRIERQGKVISRAMHSRAASNEATCQWKHILGNIGNHLWRAYSIASILPAPLRIPARRVSESGIPGTHLLARRAGIGGHVGHLE